MSGLDRKSCYDFIIALMFLETDVFDLILSMCYNNVTVDLHM